LFMKKPQIIISIIAVALGIVLFTLPKVVVDNQEEEIGDQTTLDQSSAVQMHSGEIPASTQEKIADLRYKLAGDNTEKSATFADSLAEVFFQLSFFDSAGYYAEVAAELAPTEEYWLKAGDIYYEGFSFAVDDRRVAEFGKKSRVFYQRVLDSSPDRLDLKSRMAMTYVSSSNPMKGIMMLREVLEEDPNNQEAISNLGVLALQSGQFERAVSRFEKLIELDPENLQAQVLLGVSYKEAGKRFDARNQFENVKSMTTDSSVIATVESYLEEMD